MATVSASLRVVGNPPITIGRVLNGHARMYEQVRHAGLMGELCVCACCQNTIAPFESIRVVRTKPKAPPEFVKDGHVQRYRGQQTQHQDQFMVLPELDAETHIITLFEKALQARKPALVPA